jgi:hypothetical protein
MTANSAIGAWAHLRKSNPAASMRLVSVDCFKALGGDIASLGPEPDGDHCVIVEGKEVGWFRLPEEEKAQ